MIELNKNELEALRVLWKNGPLKPADIQHRFSWPIENATLRSVLRVLIQKGQVKRHRMGKAYYYQAMASRRGILSKMARRMAQVFSGGSAADLIAQLIKSEKLTRQEIHELQQIAATKATGVTSKEKGRKER
jgi:BlaI family penicillinase repressor